jgi:glutamate--cysteine ligase
VEVRLMDLNPFEPVGINANTMRFLDVFLVHCLLAESPRDTPAEIAAVARNQHRVAERGREPGLVLECFGDSAGLVEWAGQLVEQMVPIAEHFDSVYGGSQYSQAVQAAMTALGHSEELPSAKVLRAVQATPGASFLEFVLAQARSTEQAMLQSELAPQQILYFQAQAAQSLNEQMKIEAADTLPFDVYLQEYLSPRRLLV